MTFDLPGAFVAEGVGRQAHRQFRVRRRRPQHAAHQHVAGPGIRRTDRVLHLTACAHLHVAAPNLHADLMGLSVPIAFGGLDSEQIVRGDFVSHSLECTLRTGNYAEQRAARATRERLEAGFAEVSVLRGRLRGTRLCSAADRRREHQHVDVHARLLGQCGQRGDLALASFDH